MQANSSPQLTSETSLGYSTANNSISQNAENVKTLFEDSKKYFSDRRVNRDREVLREVIANSDLRGNYTDKAGLIRILRKIKKNKETTVHSFWKSELSFFKCTEQENCML